MRSPSCHQGSVIQNSLHFAHLQHQGVNKLRTLTSLKMSKAAKNPIQKLQANPFVHILQEERLLSSIPFEMLSLMWKPEPGKHSLLYGLHRRGTMQKRHIHKDPLSPTIQQLIDSIESRTNRSSPSTLWKLKSRTFLTEDKPSTPSFSRLTLAAAIAFWDLFVASNAQFRSFAYNQTQFEYRFKCYSHQSLIKVQSNVINILSQTIQPQMNS